MSRVGSEMRIIFSPGNVRLVQEEPMARAPRVLVTGATGLLGRAVYKEFQSNGWSVIGTGYKRTRPHLLRCDLTDEDTVRGLLQEHKPDVIVHCAAERRPDVVERHTEAAVNLNVHATGTLAMEAGPSVPKKNRKLMKSISGTSKTEEVPDDLLVGSDLSDTEGDRESSLRSLSSGSSKRMLVTGDEPSDFSAPIAARGALFLYISTDYVFDGRNPPYGEDDSPNPLNVYGRSKLEGERETLRHCPGAVVLRVPVLFGDVETVSESAVTVLWLKVQDATESCTLDHCQQRFPTDTRDVAAVCRKLSERARQDPSIKGIFHFSAKQKMTKYEMAVAIAQAFNLPSNHLIPLTEQLAASTLRPINSQLNCSRLELLNLSVEPRPFATAITDALWPFQPDKCWRQTVFH